MELTAVKRFFSLQTAEPTGIINTTSRVASIDVLRGLVMIIMALDHVRDYFHADAFLFEPTDLGKTTPFLFFTRFITHYCAPTFMLLSGTSAYLVGLRKGRKALTTFLIIRGFWLIFLELTIINFGWFFDIHYLNTGTLVIWALGVGMIFLALMIQLPMLWIMIVSLVMIFGHNLLDKIQVTTGFGKYIWAILHEPNVFPFKNITWFALYPLIPWVGVMSLGYCLGKWYEPAFDAVKRRKWLMWAGVASIILFIALRYINRYGDSSRWSTQPDASFTILSFLNVSKYPPSLLYLLVTLGPALIFLSLTEKSNGWISKQIQIIGRVPMFYYLVHIYLIHLGAMVAAEFVSGHNWSDLLLTNWVSFDPKMQGFGFSLGITYIIWVALIIILYFLCRWYDAYKRTHKHWWLSYL